MSQTIFDVLREEHDRHRTLLDILVKTSGDSTGRDELFNKVRDELHAHARAEEMTLYAAMMAESQGVKMSRHSVAEHKELNDYLAELGEKPYSSPGWLAAAKKLRDRARHHMAEEEQQVFPLAGRLLSDARKRELAAAFVRERDGALEAA